MRMHPRQPKQCLVEPMKRGSTCTRSRNGKRLSSEMKSCAKCIESVHWVIVQHELFANRFFLTFAP